MQCSKGLRRLQLSYWRFILSAEDWPGSVTAFFIAELSLLPWTKFHVQLAQVAEKAIIASEAAESAQALAERIVLVSLDTLQQQLQMSK